MSTDTKNKYLDDYLEQVFKSNERLAFLKVTVFTLIIGPPFLPPLHLYSL